MANADNGAPAAAVTLVLVTRQIRLLERELAVDYCGCGAPIFELEGIAELTRLLLAAELLEAALLYHQGAARPLLLTVELVDVVES